MEEIKEISMISDECEILDRVSFSSIQAAEEAYQRAMDYANKRKPNGFWRVKLTIRYKDDPETPWAMDLQIYAEDRKNRVSLKRRMGI
tara:strand:+ start:67612 stop:67875 length:264 start_codon:yes stop_codon:yes gene_type:complete